ncbi:MAG: ABC transporter substrate-binding protein [Actinobacteria bacterium]|nr:ABC transporter substrate-binding protein [Actinomycetota bacterium]MBU1609084.1 ABC transporter substrate-binding protein [Actinomycetota bacterium]MBU2316864.1 ABC transporter substrate-binding protein [Actinomycetota bacterium]MBU2384117.1 ABC transporter substrate-binding protein [Actinomycetota bacterium]QOD94917.1 ABC transporter substrate-binding protein [Chryseoglobus sp. 28M-23]
MTLGLVATLAACSAEAGASSEQSYESWDEVVAAAEGQTVKLWMYGGDEQGNAYVNDVLVLAAAEQGVTLEQVPIADTPDALNRILSEVQAGETDGEVDLVWVNGNNFGTGKEAGAWECGWTDLLPNMALTDPADPLLLDDFGTPVDGCEAPWHKAQFTFVYNSDTVTDVPSTLDELLDWARANPGRFTYPAPPDFTGSVFVREVLYSVSGGYENVPLAYSEEAFEELTPALYDELTDLAPSLWRGGETYPQNSNELNELFANGEVDVTMTYGPATLTELVADGTYPAGTQVLTLDEGTVGNASFLGLASTSGSKAGAMVVANLALSVEQQVAKAEPDVWGQFTVLDLDQLSDEERALFEALPTSPVVPSYDVLSENANPELAAAWVTPIDEAWRAQVLAR